jgi:DNA mismatch repair protein MutL
MSSKIAVLAPEVANRIAAGEVVERPSSAVKELVENAIDAGAARITIDVAEAGRRHIRVTDDGEGMTQADAARAFLRHATSKIRTDSDLFTIRSLGFRGEALPSIAAVSRIRLVTTAVGASCGTELHLEGGTIKEERDAPAPPGTTIEVADLFYNTPARKKFLKSPATEFGHICQIVQRLALGFPNIHFRLVHNGGSVMEFPPARSARERIQQVYGLSLVDRCVDVADGDEELRLEGVSSRPLDSGLSRMPQEILVNQRWIKCPALAHAVYEAYGTYLAKGKHPRFVLNLSIDPRALDMNVHPAKREVRFSNQESLHEAVRRRIRDAISAQTSVSVSNIVCFSTQEEQPKFSERPLHPPTPGRTGQTLSGTRSNTPLGVNDGVAEAVQSYLPAVETGVQPLGQIAERYLVAQVGGELQIVDQHTAHERVLFERLTAAFSKGTLTSQQSLLPPRMEVSTSVAMAIRQHADDLERLGFDVEDFGGNTFLLRAVPALLAQSNPLNPESMLLAVIEDSENDVAAGAFKDRYHAALASMACHSAVRSGRRMEAAEIRQLLQDWRDAGLPSTCPHGRRIAMRLTIEELDRIFGRQGWAS